MWVANRIASAVDSVLVPISINNVSQLFFACNLRRRMKSNSSRESGAQ